MRDLVNHRKLPDGRMVLFDRNSNRYYDPVTDTYLNQDEVIRYGLMENTIQEKAPPSKEAEDWIKSNKENFKKQYGKDWEPVLYATAWKRFGNKLNEAIDPSVKILRRKGFKIMVQKLSKNDTLYEVEKDGKSGTIVHYKDEDKFHVFVNQRSKYKYDSLEKAVDHFFKLNEHEDTSYTDKWTRLGFNIDEMETSEGIIFTVSKDGHEVIITEPEDGVYNTDGSTFNTFDDALTHHIKTTNVDYELSESSDIRKILEKLDRKGFWFNMDTKEKAALNRAYELGNTMSKYSSLMKGSSYEADEFLDLLYEYPHLKNKLIAQYDKGKKDKE